MPNGGSDCCGTCWFNEKNKGEAGYSHAHDPEPDFCTIRHLPIRDPFYTYCANHPHHNPGKVDIPVGPMFIGDLWGNREVWMQAPSDQETRDKALALLSKLPDALSEEQPGYLFGVPLAEMIIRQIAEWLDHRAIPELERIAHLPTVDLAESNVSPPELWAALQRVRLIDAAREAVTHIRSAAN